MYAIDSCIPGSGIVGLDLVFEAHLALVADLQQRAEQRREVQHAAADFDLAVLVGLHLQVLDVHVVQPVVAVEARLDGVGAGADGVADVDAEAHALVARLDRRCTRPAGAATTCPRDRGCG